MTLNLIRVRLADVVDAVVEIGGVTHRDLLGTSRKFIVNYWRQRAFATAYHLTGQSLPQIGRHFGKDHTTVLYAVRKFCDPDPVAFAEIMQIATRAIEIAEGRGYLRRVA